MRNPRSVVLIAFVAGFLAATPALAQTKSSATETATASSAPAESSLTVGALQLGAAANLAVAAFDIHVESDSVVYSYFLKNTGDAELDVTATVSLPELQASSDRHQTWVLASNDPDNPVGLTITSGDAPVTTTAQVHAYALGLDRLAEIKAEHLPLIPFGVDIDKRLATLAPDAAQRLAALGLISLPDAAQKTPATADWLLSVVRSWHEILPPRKTTPVVIKFTPVKARYRLGKDSSQDLEEIKDEICLKPQALGVLQARLKANGAWMVTDISLADDGPSRWLGGPKRTLSVQKPKPDAIVAFCGMDEKTVGKPAVLGLAPDDSEEIRVVIFEPAGT